MNPSPPTPVAIVGIGCRFPGGVTGPASFWRLLAEGGDAITEIPADRIDLGHYFDPRPATPGRMMSRWGGFLDTLDRFDAEFFGVSPREAERMDPQQRLLLECAWEGLEDAGIDPTRLDGSNTAVFVGQWVSDFESRLFADPENVDFLMTTGSGRYALAGRLSYLLGLRGPSLSLDSACSSSLAAVHLAARAIQNGESDLALAGGVNLILQPHISIAYSQSRMMAPDGRCKFGDADGDGYVRSEGAGLVVLKPLARAQADGDRIYAVLRGSAVNNDGRSSGVMGRPSRIGHEEMLRTAYRDAGVAPSSVSYVEAHGTGTRAGDPVEIDALAKVLGEGREAGSTCLMGSVKTNIGHTEGAAGVAGLIKACLALHHQRIPASLHCRTPNPAVAWSTLPVAIAREAQAWPRGTAPRFAGVNSFGIGGTNAHAVLEEAPVLQPATTTSATMGDGSTTASSARPAALLVLSARAEPALRALAASYADRLASARDDDVAAICWNAATRRAALEHRAAFVAGSRGQLVDALRGYAAREAPSAEGRVREPGRPLRTAFVMPGQGAQWRGMARDLLRNEPVFRETFERCDAAARRWLDVSLTDQLHAEPGSAGDRFDDIDVVQPLLVALALAYAAWWQSNGVRPDAVMGHSMGEVAAAAVAGALSLDEAMRVICRRSQLMKTTSGQGAMAMVDLSMDEAQARLRGREAHLAVAVSNSPRSSVVSGEPAAVQALMDELQGEGVFCRLVKVDVASHSPQMQPLADALGAELADLRPAETSVPLYATVLARRADGGELGAAYWAANLRQPVRFAQTLARALEDGIGAAIELGPHPVLLPAMQQTAQAAGRELQAVACGQRDQDGATGLLTAAGALWCAGGAIDWARLMPAAPPTELPTYPWQRERHWIDAALRPASPGRERVKRHRPDDESLGWLYALRWQALDAPAPCAPSPGPWLVVSDDLDDAGAVVRALQAQGASATASVSDRWTSALAGAHQVLWLVPDTAEAAWLPVHALQALLKAGSPARLWFATRGAQAVNAGARVAVMPAALWGSARVLAEEHPERWGGLVDRDPAARGDAASLAHHLLAADGEDQVALRGGYRFVARLRALEPAPAPTSAPWRADASVLITGGLGGIGLLLAAELVRQGARRLILMGRTALPPRATWAALDASSPAGRRVAAVRALEAMGASVHLAAVDVGDENQLCTFLDAYAAEGWPPIRAVVHAAGALDNHLVSAMDGAAFGAALQAKLHGARLLDRLLPDLDLFVLFSSTGALLAQAGQANYAAANAGLDALALDRRARGLPAISIAWGVWADTGLVHDEAGQRNVAEMNRQGIAAFAPARGLALFHALIASDETTPVVLPIDWARFAQARAGRRSPLFTELQPDAAALPASGEALAEATPAQRRQALEAVVKEAVGKVLKVAPARLDPRKALGAMGLNSLMAMELRNRLEAALGRPLSATLAWNYPTVEALSAHLAGDGPPEPIAVADEPSAAALEAPVLQVAGLSDDEAALALRGNRRRGVR
ncbi:MAG: SDR family NAD(P)-dependent oxidoreductase [Hydrogenophaga sp.]|uniref:type I polyketide synthase n=1 Tax=Hydrogenophaga sp. TaxID=1904254 RepID=UPI0016A07C9A|nr:type I polyketide synthase [Hydrogenophaga sp.]NIM40823.1 SDR family NAD(P)-dependent oxidoreductase [Hydrogenophaga sp.]NIN26298.1 SDR family NAD(P)-dependent oxidoreductase [Hydrogenophaga sp.]NIN31163.1 SDR family NAD(P)-dependent oxidoreductase [Hydrogenophaga sp.]NIN55206.1 SDR family NAD(P)-dependent oxidoreductase [Hydrogenophaga sp.]NIO51249.1 SDR family NAD(P)-dependent oxidoreductase [Hydrogenophaga sp.]